MRKWNTAIFGPENDVFAPLRQLKRRPIQTKKCFFSLNLAQIKKLSDIFKDLGSIHRITRQNKGGYNTLVRSRQIFKILPLIDKRIKAGHNYCSLISTTLPKESPPPRIKFWYCIHMPSEGSKDLSITSNKNPSLLASEARGFLMITIFGNHIILIR